MEIPTSGRDSYMYPSQSILIQNSCHHSFLPGVPATSAARDLSPKSTEPVAVVEEIQMPKSEPPTKDMQLPKDTRVPESETTPKDVQLPEDTRVPEPTEFQVSSSEPAPNDVQLPEDTQVPESEPPPKDVQGGGNDQLPEDTPVLEPKRLSPSQRTRLFLLEKRLSQENKDKKTLGKGHTKQAEEKVPVVPTPVRNDKKHTPQSTLPPKPSDWNRQTVVTANEQQPPKPRGRKPKAKVEQEGAAKAKAKAKAKSKATPKAKSQGKNVRKRKQPNVKSDIAGKDAYEPLQIEEPIGANKALAFDACATACAVADAYTLAFLNENKPNSSASDSSSKVKKTNNTSKVAEVEEGKHSTNDGIEVKRRKKSQVAEVEEPKQPTNGKSAEQKAKLSRKSCAYKKVLAIKRKEGLAEEDAKKAARDVTRLH